MIICTPSSVTIFSVHPIFIYHILSAPHLQLPYSQCIPSSVTIFSVHPVFNYHILYTCYLNKYIPTPIWIRARKIPLVVSSLAQRNRSPLWVSSNWWKKSRIATNSPRWLAVAGDDNRTKRHSSSWLKEKQKEIFERIHIQWFLIIHTYER